MTNWSSDSKNSTKFLIEGAGSPYGLLLVLTRPKPLKSADWTADTKNSSSSATS